MNIITKLGQVLGLVLLAAAFSGCASTDTGKQSDSGTKINGYISTGATKKL